MPPAGHRRVGGEVRQGGQVVGGLRVRGVDGGPRVGTGEPHRDGLPEGVEQEDGGGGEEDGSGDQEDGSEHGSPRQSGDDPDGSQCSGPGPDRHAPGGA